MSKYTELLNLIEKHTALFDELAEIQQIKLKAITEENTIVLEDCMRKEQAHTLALRGFDKKREEMQKAMSLDGKTFRDIIPLVPEEFQDTFQAAFTKLTDAYNNYRTVSDCTKEMLEVSIYKLGIAMNKLKEKSGLKEADFYTADGSLSQNIPTRRDIKV